MVNCTPSPGGGASSGAISMGVASGRQDPSNEAILSA